MLYLHISEFVSIGALWMLEWNWFW